MTNRPILVKPQEIAVPPPRAVTVRNASLVNAFVQKPQEALELLGMVAPVKLDEISIDERGYLTVENEEFIRALRAVPGVVTGRPGGLAEGNGICGAGCGEMGSIVTRPIDPLANNGICGAGCGAQAGTVQDPAITKRRG